MQNVSAAMRPSLFQYRAKLNNAFLKSLYEIGPRFESDPIRLINTYHQKERNFRFFRSWGCAIFTLTIRKCEGTMKGYRPDGLCF